MSKLIEIPENETQIVEKIEFRELLLVCKALSTFALNAYRQLSQIGITEPVYLSILLFKDLVDETFNSYILDNEGKTLLILLSGHPKGYKYKFDITLKDITNVANGLDLFIINMEKRFDEIGICDKELKAIHAFKGLADKALNMFVSENEGTPFIIITNETQN